MLTNPGEPDIAPPLTSMWNSFPGQVGQQTHAVIDGVRVPLWFGLAAEAGGSAVRCPNNDCGPRTIVNSQGQTVLTSPFQAFAGGKSGYWIDEDNPNSDNENLVFGVRTHFIEAEASPFIQISWSPVKSETTSIFDEIRKAVNRPAGNEVGAASCADLLGGKDELLKIVNLYEQNIGKVLEFKKMKDSEVDATTSRTKSKKIDKQKIPVITINTNSSRYDSDTFGFQNENNKQDFGHLDFTQWWAALILHEIAHALDVIDGGNRLTDDSNDKGVSRANQKFIVESCFPKPEENENSTQNIAE